MDTVCKCVAEFLETGQSSTEGYDTYGYSSRSGAGVLKQKTSDGFVTFSSMSLSPTPSPSANVVTKSQSGSSSAEDPIAISVPLGVFFLFVVIAGIIYATHSKHSSEIDDAWKVVNNGIVCNETMKKRDINENLFSKSPDSMIVSKKSSGSERLGDTIIRADDSDEGNETYIDYRFEETSSHEGDKGPVLTQDNNLFQDTYRGDVDTDSQWIESSDINPQFRRRIFKLMTVLIHPTVPFPVT